MEEVDEAPRDLFGVVFKGGVRKQSEEVGPDSGQGLLDRVRVWQFGRGGGADPLDFEVAELELRELGGKRGVHEVSPVKNARPSGDGSPRTRHSRPPRTARHARETPGPRPARAAPRSGATRAERTAGCGERRRVRAPLAPVGSPSR